MKSLYRIMLVAAVVLSSQLLSSCAVSHKVHTARSMGLGAEITQMPTVVELDVQPEQKSAEVSWVNRAFKQRISRKTQEQELIAKILKESNADILVEPKVSHNQTSNLFKSNHNLTVSGYPARYKDFRPASMEDIEKINAMRGITLKTPDVKAVVCMQSDNASKAAPALSGAVKPARPSLFKRSRTAKSYGDMDVERTSRYNRKTGYRGFIHGGYMSNVGNEGYTDTFSGSTTHGYQIIPQFFAGVGAGFYEIVSESYNWDVKDLHLIPVYLSLRGDLLNRRVSPFVETRIGANVNDESCLYVGACVGARIGHFDVGCEYALFDVCSFLGIRVGFSF